MADETLAVAPAGLRTAAQIIASHAVALSVSRGDPDGTAEQSATAAAAVYRALDGYRDGFSRRLLAVSDALTRAADHYTGMDTSTGRAVTSLVALGQPWP